MRHEGAKRMVVGFAGDGDKLVGLGAGSPGAQALPWPMDSPGNFGWLKQIVRNSGSLLVDGFVKRVLTALFTEMRNF